MHRSHPPSSKTFSLLSIGQRGVGKTVFLAGSYAELGSESSSDASRPFWFECQDPDVQANLEKILDHVKATGLYPPATIKVTSFHFNLQQRRLWGVKTLCQFRWWDIPGESCNLNNPDFQAMVLASQGCCVFISAAALIHQQNYEAGLEDIFSQVIAIATLVHHHQMQYAFALVLTKCDLLLPGPITQLKLEQSLQPLLTRLNQVQAQYQTFYSAIPIVSLGSLTTLNARGAADPLLWLLAELNHQHRFHAQPTLASGITQNLFVGQLFPVYLRRYVLLLAVISTTLLGAIAALLLLLDRPSSLPEPSTLRGSSDRLIP